jgi:galactokinase
MKPRNKVIRGFQKRFGCLPEFIGQAPGRVNLMGEHVDYNEGCVLPVAIDRTVHIAFSPSHMVQSTIQAADIDGEIQLDPRGLVERVDADGVSLPGWGLYPAGVMQSVIQEGLSAPGIQAVFSADIPRGAGLSSSAAVELAFMKAWQTAGGWERPAPALAVMAQRAESQYVGVRCGIMDQYASACGRQGHAIYLDCRDLTSRYVALPQGYSIVIADSGVRHSLAAGAYNNRRTACEEAVRILREKLPGIHALRDVSVDEFERHAEGLPEEIQCAARHVVYEMERTEHAIERLEAGDVAGFGSLMMESHASLKNLYRVSCPELDALVRIATILPGCLGARLTGAGFGGCTVNVVERDRTDVFMEELKKRYQKETGITPAITRCQAEDGAKVAVL